MRGWYGGAQQMTVEFDQVRLQLADPIQIGMADAEVVDGDQKAAAFQHIDALYQCGVHFQHMFQHFQHHLAGIQPGGLDAVGQRHRAFRPRQRGGVDIEKQPAWVVALHLAEANGMGFARRQVQLVTAFGRDDGVKASAGVRMEESCLARSKASMPIVRRCARL